MKKAIPMKCLTKKAAPTSAGAYQSPSVWIQRVMLFCTVVLLAACAAQQAARQGESLLAEGKIVEGLEKLQQASSLDRSDPRYRMQYLNVRDTVVNAALNQADQALAAKRYADAQSSYKQALAVDSANARAADGLRDVEQAKRHDSLFSEALSSWNKKDPHSASAKLRQILTENPKQEAARNLQREIAQATARSPEQTQLSAAYRKAITIEFKDTPIRTLFEIIARTSGLNFVFDKDVKLDQRTSIFLKNSSIEKAINIVLLTNQLEQRVLDTTSVLIYPATAAKQKDYTPLSVKSFYLSNADVKSVANSIRTLVKTRDIVMDEKLNLLIVRDSPEAIRLAEKIVALHDVAEPEVMLEVEILEIKRTRLTELGIRWPDQLSLAPLSSNSGALTLDELRRLNSRTISAAIGPVTLNARTVDSDANLLANPRIRTKNREKARIMIGERVPNITSTATATGFVSESVNYVDVGLKLEVEPTIYPNNEVTIKVALEVSNIISQLSTKSGSVAYQIGTRNANTVLRLKDGENQVLAGLINDEDRSSGNKIPGIGRIPLLGRLFGSQADDGSKTEIVLSITPRLIRNIQRPENELAEFDSGTESSVRARADGASTNVGPLVAALNSATSPSGNFSPPPLPLNAPENTGTLPQNILPATNFSAPTPLGENSSLPSSPSTFPSPNSSFGESSTLPLQGSSPTPPVVGGGIPNPVDASASALAQLRWQGSTSLKVGDALDLQLLLQTDAAINTMPLAISFDPKVLQISRISEGDFFKKSGGQSSFSSRIDPSGQIVITANRLGSAPLAPELSALLLTLNFRALAATPQTQIQVLAASPAAVNGRAVSAPLPAPHTLQINP